MALLLGLGFASVLAAFELGIRSGWFTTKATSVGRATVEAARASRPVPARSSGMMRGHRPSAGRA